MYTFSEKRPRAVASAREISYDRGKGGDGVIEILEQTPQLVLCVKPVGVRAQGEAEADLPALLKRQLGCEIYPVHRLDQAVGGVMVFAKTAPAAAKLSQAIAGGTLQKEYLAVLGARPKDDSGELFDLLFHDRFKNKTYVVSKERKGRQKSLAFLPRCGRGGRLCLVHGPGCIPEGRTRFACSLPPAAARWQETENTEAGKMQLRPLCGPTR